MIKLSDELKAAGYEGDVAAFRDRLTDVFVEMFRSWTVEELTFHPKEAVHLCNVVRRATGAPDLPDFVILRTLSNKRKKGDMPRHRRRKRRQVEAVA